MYIPRTIRATLPVPSDLIVTLDTRPEDMPVEGNASAWGDGTDEPYWAEIRDRLDAGDEWAWCIVKVTVTDGTVSGHDYLGGCCYRDAADFMQEGGHFRQMVEEAYESYKANAASDAINA